MHGMIGRPVAVSARPRIGKLAMIRREFPAGFTLADMAAEIAPEMPPEFFAIGIAVIDDGGPIEPQHWHLIRPKAGHCVAFLPMPGKEGGLLGTFAQIAIIAAQAFAYTIPGVGPLIAAGIGLGGSMLLGALNKPKNKSQKPPKQLGQAGFSDNVLAPYEQIPRVLGERRVPANYLVPPVYEISGDNALGRAATGLAGRYEIREIQMAGGPAEFVVSHLREGDASDLDLEIYTDVRWQEVPDKPSRHNVLVDTASDTRRTFSHSPVLADLQLYDLPRPMYFRLGRRRFPKRLVIDLLFDQGLYRIDSNAKAGVALELFFTKPGAANIYIPQLHLRGNFKTPTRAKLVIEFSADPGSLTAPNNSNIWRQAFATTTQQTTDSSAAHTYYGTSAAATHVGVTDPNTCTVYVDPASIPLDGSYRLAIKVGLGYLEGRMSYSDNTYQFNGGGAIFPRWFKFTASGAPGAGPPYVAFEDQAFTQTNLVFEHFTRIYNTEALVADGIATYEIETQNQSVEQITFLAGSYVDKRWNGTAWVAEPHVSNNPAELAYDIMTNASPALNARALDESLVDGAALGEWADYCTEQGLTCNAYIDSGSVEDALQVCFEAGHAYLKRSQKWGVYIERSRAGETPVMIFSPRNSRGFRVERSYDHRPHALRVTFDDEDDDYQTQPDLVVYAPGHDATTATNFLSRHYPGITQEWQAVRRAQIDLGIIYYRAKAYTLETDARYLVAGRGDLVGISHFVLNAAHGFAAIREVIRQDVGGSTKITGFRLDTDLDLQPATTAIAVNTFGGTVVSAISGQGGKTRELILTSPLADDPEIEAGCTITSGSLSAQHIECIIDDVQPGAGGTARLVLYDAAPEIFGAVEVGNDLYASPDLYAETDLYNLNN